MAKDIYLTYNSILDNYCFTDSKNPADFSRRRELNIDSPKGLLEKLNLHIDSKRKSILHLSNISEEVVEEIREEYDGTKIEVNIARKNKD
jgi:hypothetical protein